jgi:hypothetical protein
MNHGRIIFDAVFVFCLHLCMHVGVQVQLSFSARRLVSVFVNRVVFVIGNCTCADIAAGYFRGFAVAIS